MVLWHIIDQFPNLRVRRNNRTMVVWADAICINQNDRIERSQQVSIMRAIYEGARSVLVWLGPHGNPDAALQAKQIILTAANLCRMETGSPLPTLLDFAIEHPSGVLNLLYGFPSPGSFDWMPLVDFFNRPWFKRMWVIQEAAASASVLLMAGELEVNWVDVGLAYLWFNAKDYMRIITIPGSQNIFTAAVMWSSTKLYGEPRYPLLHQLKSYWTKEVTDPKDKIYGLLGLCKEDTALAEYPLL
jgi:hypothetical protein